MIDTDRILEKARKRIDRLDHLGAYELLEPHLRKTDGADARIIHTGILSLAAIGATESALETFELHRDLLVTVHDYAALEARLLKDLFYADIRTESGWEFGRRALELYRSIHERSGTSYAAINAAGMALFLGDTAESERLATIALSLAEGEPEGYWRSATIAEAYLLLRDFDLARATLEHASTLAPSEDKKAVTFRQLSMEIRTIGGDPALLASIRPKSVVIYTGHLIHGLGKTPGIDPDDRGALYEECVRVLKERDVGHAFGSLACGADIILAEAAIAVGAELHVCLPFSVERFREISVAPAGSDWVARFDSLLEQAATSTILVDDPGSDHDLLYRTATRITLGKARLLSGRIGAPVFQLALWNREPAASASGTARDIEQWKELGGETVVIPVRRPRNASISLPPTVPSAVRMPHTRGVRALIFADLSGFSKLPEAESLSLYPAWTARVDELLTNRASSVKLVNTWGDAVYVVLDDVLEAAVCALELSTLYDHLRREFGLAHAAAFRVSAHAAPVFEIFDPLLKKNNFVGAHVNTTSRMEPCTPPGTVYVTENFAALLALHPDSGIVSQYAGIRELPKNHGSLRMYRLRKRS